MQAWLESGLLGIPSNKCTLKSLNYVPTYCNKLMTPSEDQCTLCLRKKQDTKLFPITSQMLTDFQNSFTGRLTGKFATNHIYSTTP